MDDSIEFGKPIKKVTSLKPVDSYLTGSWEALGAGAPVLVALAQLCSQAMIDEPVPDLASLSNEAKAILVASRKNGTIEVKAVNSAFEAASRLLAIYVEVDEERTIAFRDPKEPEITIRFMEGFRQLCKQGLVLHHIHHDFSLSQVGFELARTLSLQEYEPWLNKGTEFGIHD